MKQEGHTVGRWPNSRGPVPVLGRCPRRRWRGPTAERARPGLNQPQFSLGSRLLPSVVAAGREQHGSVETTSRGRLSDNPHVPVAKNSNLANRNQSDAKQTLLPDQLLTVRDQLSAMLAGPPDLGFGKICKPICEERCRPQSACWDSTTVGSQIQSCSPTIHPRPRIGAKPFRQA